MRILFLKRLFFAGLLFLWMGLVSLQILQGARFREEAEKNRTRLIHLKAARGSILDRSGHVLVEDVLSFECAVFPQELSSAEGTFRRLAPFLRISSEQLAARYRTGYQGPFAPVTLVAGIPANTAFLLEEKRGEIPGVLIRPVPQRRYRLGPALGPVAGYLGLISQEELRDFKSYGYTFRDLVGKDGLELAYDSVLRGKSGGLQVEVNATGRFVRQLSFRPAEAGRDITISLDGRLQSFCHRLLDGLTGSVVVIDSSSGEILALASRPTFDPNAFVDWMRRLEVKEYLHQKDRPMFNRAHRALVPPGSTFKMAVAYEALRSGKITRETTFFCPGSFRLGNAVFRCWKKEGHGALNVEAALEHSCNVFFYHTGRRLGAEGIERAARLFGLGSPTQIDLPYESKGLVPDPSWMMHTWKQPWGQGDTISYAIGQSALTATPLQMLRMVNAFATDGRIPRPHLWMEGASQAKAATLKPTRIPSTPATTPDSSRIPMDANALASVKRGLQAVVASDTGTGRLAQVPGIEAAGKTGTAQTPKGETHAWFCGYAPSDRPKVSFAIFLEYGGKGGEQAAWLARDLLAALRELNYL